MPRTVTGRELIGTAVANLGRNLVKQYVESRGTRWDEFVRLLASPRLPSGLRAPADPRH